MPRTCFWTAVVNGQLTGEVGLLQAHGVRGGHKVELLQQKLIIEIDQQSTLFLSLPIFPLIEDWKKFLSQCVIFCFLFLKKEKKKEKNLHKYYPPILLKPTDIRKRTCNAESQKGSAVSELSNA